MTKECLLEALWKYFDLEGVYKTIQHDLNYIGYHYERTKEGLIEYCDRSYHGSPDYIPSGYTITNPDKLKAYDLLIELEKLLINKKEG